MDRAERRHRTYCQIERRKKVLDWTGLLDVHPSYYAENDPAHIIGRARSFLIGRCKKIKPLDCGRSRCGVCGYWKRIKRYPSVTEYKHWLSYREQAAEFGHVAKGSRKPA